jgi:hypothetical protein
MNLTQCATVFGTLLIFRQIGFRLVRTHTLKPPGVVAGQDDL